MKKTLFSIITLVVSCLFAVNVNASMNRIIIPNSTKAKAPETIPSTADTLYGTVTEDFDFSKLQFAPSSGNENIAGKTDLKKIIIGDLKNISSASSLTLDSSFNKWFTAYCLDNAKKYPKYGVISSTEYAGVTTDELRLDYAVLAALAFDTKVQKAIDNKVDTSSGVISSIQVVEIDDDTNTIAERYYELTGTDTPSTVISKIEALNETVIIKLKKIEVTKGNSIISINASDITGNAGDTTYDLTFKGKDILFDKYVVTDNTKKQGYDHAIWIIEHSYPTLALKTSVEAAGANFDSLRKEICELEGHTFDDTALTCTGFAALDDYVENYVYGTIQYAIWKVTGHKVGSKELGGEIKNSTELDKLYKFLIKDRSEISGYGTKTFANKITVETPEEGKEECKDRETKSSYVYGPYTADYDVLKGADMTLSVTNADKTGIKLVNEDGDEITTLEKGGTFYIECLKSAKISNVTVSIKLEDASVFDPLTNRGRVYNPVFRLEQNVLSGGKIVNKNLETTIELVANPKTGVENVALLLMVTLVAFTLAYLLLSYKQKPIQLS